MLSIVETLRQRRREKKYTQQEVADNTGLSRSYIADIERGRYNPSINVITKISKCLDLELVLAEKQVDQ